MCFPHGPELCPAGKGPRAGPRGTHMGPSTRDASLCTPGGVGSSLCGWAVAHAGDRLGLRAAVTLGDWHSAWTEEGRDHVLSQPLFLSPHLGILENNPG